MSSLSSMYEDKFIVRWLSLLIILVICMIVLGGATRLTNSGLSITEWEVVKGTLPPLNQLQWQEAFNKYKQIPEYLQEHPDMTLGGFKHIYYWEWSHRLLGRVIGLVYIFPYLYFLFSMRLPKGKGFRFFSIGILILLQGVIGWYMVRSGLGEGMVDVSQYMLALHLGLAFFILGLLYWTYKDQRDGWSFRSEIPANPLLGFVLAFLVYMQIIAGAFVAGTHAGKTYNTWPLMDGQFIPEGYGQLSPFYKNLGENIATIQFNHRMLAYVIFTVVLLFYWRVRSISKIRSKAFMLLMLILAQMILGVFTLLHNAPLNLSLAHQFLAIFVFISAIGTWRGARLGY